jgi:hypothetical protein
MNQEIEHFNFEKAKEFAPWIRHYHQQSIQNFKYYTITIDEKIGVRNKLLLAKSKEEIFDAIRMMLA